MGLLQNAQEHLGQISREKKIVAAMFGAQTFTWYALPDFIHSRRDRGLVKTLLLGAMALVGSHIVGELAVREQEEGKAGSGGYLDQDILAGDKNRKAKKYHEDPVPVTAGNTTEDNSGTGGCSGGCHCQGDSQQNSAGCASGLQTANGSDLTDPDRVEEEHFPLKLVLLGVGFLVTSVALSITLEKWWFSRAERRRMEGVAYPHTRQALPMAVAVSLSALLGE